MESRSYIYPRHKKVVKSISGLLRLVNACKMLIILQSCQSSNPELMFEYNTINSLDLPSDNNKIDISLEISNNGKKEIRSADMDNDKEDIRSADIDK